MTYGDLVPGDLLVYYDSSFVVLSVKVTRSRPGDTSTDNSRSRSSLRFTCLKRWTGKATSRYGAAPFITGFSEDSSIRPQCTVVRVVRVHSGGDGVLVEDNARLRR